MGGNVRAVLIRAFLVFIVNTSLSAYLFQRYEGLSPFDAIYWAVTVVSTVGFGDITPKTTMGKIIFMYLTLTSLAIYGYIIGVLGSLLVEVKITDILKRVLGMKVMTMERHIVVLGWNPVTSTAVSEIEAQGYKVIIVDNREDVVAMLTSEDRRVLRGDPKEPSVLKHANVPKAKAVLIFLDNDHETIMATLSVRSISKTVDVVVGLRSVDYYSLAKQAGANDVVVVDEIGGKLMGSMIFEPLSAEVLSDLASSKEGDLDVIQEIVKREELVSDFEDRNNCKVIAVKRISSGKIVKLPPRNYILIAGDTVIYIAKMALDRS